jgi:glycosidase
MRDWMADQIIYEVFVDRFAIGGGCDVRHKRPLLPRGAIVRRWSALPDEPPRGRDFFGGDLLGLTEHLDHIVDLGATALYLTPVFIAPSNHRYDTTDHGTVCPALGGDAALQALIDACTLRGLRIVLDAVLNHVSDRHLRAREGRGMLSHDGVTQHWRGFGHMPELDLDDRSVRQELFEGDSALVPRWISRGVAGWRLDVAADLGPRIVRDVTHATHTARRDACVVAELMSFPGGWMGREGDADGVMNYYVRRAMLDWIEDPARSPVRLVTRAVCDVIEACGLAAATRSWSMLASHDTPRALDACGDPARAALATTLQFTLPGAPVIYYGEEVGLRGAHDPANRAPMPWNPALWNTRTLAHHRALTALRRRHVALRRGRFVDLCDRASEGVLAFARVTDDPEETVLVVAHNHVDARVAHVHLPLGALHDAIQFVDALDDAPRDAPWRAPVWIEAGRVRLTLPPHHGVRVLRVESGYIPGYRFLRKRV